MFKSDTMPPQEYGTSRLVVIEAATASSCRGKFDSSLGETAVAPSMSAMP